MVLATLRMGLLAAPVLLTSCAAAVSPPAAEPATPATPATAPATPAMPAPPGIPSAPATTCSADTLFMGEGWVRPKAVFAPPPVVTAERVLHARDRPARFRCQIGLDGALHECEVIEALVSQIPTLLAVLPTWRFTPATCQGTPFAVRMAMEVYPEYVDPDAPSAAPAASPPGNEREGAAPTAPTPARQPAAPRSAVIPFGDGMNRPTLISGGQPQYTPEARRAGVEGMVQARCIIQPDGTLRDCAIVRSMPLIDRSVLAALATQRYTPVTFRGVPVPVVYLLTFNFRLQ